MRSKIQKCIGDLSPTEIMVSNSDMERVHKRALTMQGNSEKKKKKKAGEIEVLAASGSEDIQSPIHIVQFSNIKCTTHGSG